MIGVALALLALTPRPAQFAAWGAEPLRLIQQEVARSDSTAYAGARLLDLPSESALMSALAAATAFDAKYMPALQTAIDSIASYWDTSGPTPGFGNLPLGKSHRSYTDNAALALALDEAARVGKSTKATDFATRALTFALSGEDAKGGGILEFEGADSVKTTGASATASQAILSQSDISTPKHAEELYTWIRTNLRDPATNLLSPALAAPGTAPAEPKAGDTARMIEVACLLYLSTKDEKFGEQARRLEVLSVGRWYRAGELNADTAGGSQLVEAWIDRVRICPRPTEVYGATSDAYAALQRLHDAGRDRGGHYGRRFGVPPTPGESWRILDQAAAARAFFAAALALRPAKK